MKAKIVFLSVLILVCTLFADDNSTNTFVFKTKPVFNMDKYRIIDYEPFKILTLPADSQFISCIDDTLEEMKSNDSSISTLSEIAQSSSTTKFDDSVAQMEKITSLRCAPSFWNNFIQIGTGDKKVYPGVTSISGIQYMKNLTEIEIISPFLFDLRPLETLSNAQQSNPSDKKLKNLKLIINFYNPGTRAHVDFRPISGFIALEKLNLTNTKISDLRPLAGLTNMKELYLANNFIYDLTPLKDMTQLEVLFLSNNLIRYTDALKYLTELELLALDNNKTLRNVKPLIPLVNLKLLALHNCNVIDFGPLSNFKHLKRLSVHENSIRLIGKLKNYKAAAFDGLEFLTVCNNNKIILPDNTVQYNDFLDFTTYAIQQSFGTVVCDACGVNNTCNVFPSTGFVIPIDPDYLKIINNDFVLNPIFGGDYIEDLLLPPTIILNPVNPIINPVINPVTNP